MWCAGRAKKKPQEEKYHRVSLNGKKVRVKISFCSPPVEYHFHFDFISPLCGKSTGGERDKNRCPSQDMPCCCSLEGLPKKGCGIGGRPPLDLLFSFSMSGKPVLCMLERKEAVSRKGKMPGPSLHSGFPQFLFFPPPPCPLDPRGRFLYFFFWGIVSVG